MALNADESLAAVGQGGFEDAIAAQVGSEEAPRENEASGVDAELAAMINAQVAERLESTFRHHDVLDHQLKNYVSAIYPFSPT